MAGKKKITFEAGLGQLEQLVAQMETGEMPLDASFEAYAQGMALVQSLNALLDAGERRISELTAQGEIIPFEAEEERP